MANSRELLPCITLMGFLCFTTGFRAFSLSAWLLCHMCGRMGYDVHV